MATARKIVLFFGSENLNAVLGWLAIMFVARRMGAAALGELGYALSIVGTFTVFALLGTGMAHIKRVSEGRDLGRCIGTFMVMRLVLTAVMALVFGVALWIWTGPLDKQIYDISGGMLPTILAYQVVLLLTGGMLATFTALQQTARTVVSRSLGNVLRSGVMVAAALTGAGVIWLARAYLLGVLLTGVVALWYFRTMPLSRPDRETFHSYRRYAMPVAALSVFGVMQQYADKLLIGIFWTEQEVGLYFGVQRIALLIGTMALALEGLLLPAMSALHTRSGNVRLGPLLLRAERYTAMAALPVVVVTAALAPGVIVVLLSREFLPATRILQLLVFAALVRVLNRPWSAALRGADRPDLTSALGIATNTLNLLLMVLLVPREIPQLGLNNLPGLGGEGAALALLITALINGLALRGLCHRYLEIAVAPRLLLQLASALAVGGALWLLTDHFAIDRWYELMAAAAAGGLLFLSLLMALGEFTRADWNFFRGALHPREMKDYLKEELVSR